MPHPRGGDPQLFLQGTGSMWVPSSTAEPGSGSEWTLPSWRIADDAQHGQNPLSLNNLPLWGNSSGSSLVYSKQNSYF